MSVKAISKGIQISPRKVAGVAALVRGRTVNDALVILENTPRRSAKAVAKTIMSARANADNNHNMKPDTLIISEIFVTPGPRLKRFRPVARGSAHPYQHKTSHLRVVVDGEMRQVKTKSEIASKKKTEGAK